MSPKTHVTSNSHLLILSVAFVIIGLSQSAAMGQPLPSAPSGVRSPNPRANGKYLAVARRDDRSKDIVNPARPNPVDEKRQAIEQAIEAGNKARDNSDFEQAFASYRKVAEELDPKDARAFYGLANVFADLACSDNAIRAYTEALKLNPNFREAIIALGNVYAGKDRLDESEAQFRSLLKANPNDADGIIGVAFIDGKRKKYDDAIRQLNSLANNSAVDAQHRANAYLVAGNILLEQKKYSDAAIEYKKVIELQYFLAGANIKLGETELRPAAEKFSMLTADEVTLGDREQMIKAAKFASENIRKAIYEYDYNHPFGYLWLSLALMGQFNYQEAENAVKTYLIKVKELEHRSSFLATKCDYGFNQLYAYGHATLAILYGQQANRETDANRKTDLNEHAMESARQVITLKEDDAGAYGMLGTAYLQTGKYEDAIQWFGKAIARENNPNSKAGIYGLLGLAYARLNRETEAIEAFRNQLKLQPESVTARIGLAQVYESQGNYDEAIRLKKEAIAGMLPTAMTHWMLASSYLARARQKDDANDYEEAIKSLKKALEINPSYWNAYFLLGQVYKFYKGEGHAELAISNYEMAAKIQPANASIYHQLGDLYYNLNKYDAAAKYFRDAIRLDPKFAAAYWELGLVLHDTGNDSEAIKNLSEAIRVDSKYQNAYFTLVSIYRAQKNYPDALKLLNKLLDLAPNDYWAYKEMAKIYEAQQQNENAIKYYQQAQSFLKPDDTFFRDVYGCRIQRLHRSYAEAIACFQKLKISGSDDSATVIFDVGMTYLAAGNKKSALAQYEQLKQMKSTLAAELLAQINESK